MVRNRSRKTNIGRTSEETMFSAVQSHLNGGLSIKQAALRYNISRTTLTRYIVKCKNKNINWEEATLTDVPRMVPNYNVRQVFTEKEEGLLVDYLQKCSRLHHGLPPREARRFAYEFAAGNEIAIPQSWKDKCSAGEDWLTAFLKRNNTLSLRKPEATSLARAMGFNKVVVGHFYHNLEQILQKYKLGPEQIYNMDETGLTTVQQPTKIIGEKGVKQIGQITSAERGSLVTVCCAINAIGNSVPPFMIFPRVHFKPNMINGAPPGTQGRATASGWISSEIFLDWMKHFIHFTKPSKNSPILLIMDNHEAHISFSVVKLAKDNHVILLTLPPHTSHRLQPLDRCVYGPLKRYYNDQCRAWLLSNPGRRISIYEIADIFGKSFDLAFTTKNVVSAFTCTGIFPFNRNVFQDDEFLPASVTDTDNINNDEVKASTSQDVNTAGPSKNQDFIDIREITPERCVTPIAIAEVRQTLNANKTTQKTITPDMIRPFPKACGKSSNPVNRRKKNYICAHRHSYFKTT